MAEKILGSSPESRIPDRVREREGLSYGVQTWLVPSSFEDNSLLNLYAIFAPENRDRVKVGIAEEMARALKDGFTDAEVKAAKEGVMQERILGRTEDGRISSALVNQAFLGRTFATSAAVDAAIGKLTPQDVNAALRKYVKPGEFATAFAGDFDKK